MINSWDTRQPAKAVQNVQAHTAEINSVAFHPRNEWMLATGSSDQVYIIAGNGYETNNVDNRII